MIISDFYPIINQEIKNFMKNIPRVFLGDNIQSGLVIPAPSDVSHYLSRVMRRRDFLAFGGGHEFYASLSDDGHSISVGDDTGRSDPSGNITLMFAPIKRTDDLLNMATQMGVAAFHPVITDHTVALHINWSRMQKIITESAEQSGRNSVPLLLPPQKFSELDLSQIVFADERAAYGAEIPNSARNARFVLVGPEGGFSDAEFSALDSSGAIGISLGKTILRAELAAAIAISRITE